MLLAIFTLNCFARNWELVQKVTFLEVFPSFWRKKFRISKFSCATRFYRASSIQSIDELFLPNPSLLMHKGTYVLLQNDNVFVLLSIPVSVWLQHRENRQNPCRIGSFILPVGKCISCLGKFGVLVFLVFPSAEISALDKIFFCLYLQLSLVTLLR